MIRLTTSCIFAGVPSILNVSATTRPMGAILIANARGALFLILSSGTSLKNCSREERLTETAGYEGSNVCQNTTAKRSHSLLTPYLHTFASCNDSNIRLHRVHIHGSGFHLHKENETV